MQIKEMTLGGKSFPNNLIQGPLAGVSCAPFRYLTWKYGQPAFSCTEMISCKTILHQSKTALKRYVQKHPHEGPVCFQLSADNAAELAEATKIVTDYGADLIDLNCGCPVKKIRSKGAGSSLLADSAKLYHLIHAMKQNTHVPVSIKVRVQANQSDHLNTDIATVVTEAGADFLTVHGRHWTENYDTPCRYDEIAFFVDALTIPVIGNGDIACTSSLKNMLKTGCAGVMIGRAGVGQPWLIKKLIAEMNNNNIFAIPDNQEIANIFIDHIEQLAVLLNSEFFAVIQARKLSKYYARDLINKEAFCTAINTCQQLTEFKQICLDFFISQNQ
jgi:tRNA-dihydrouridine synthase B